MRTYFKILIGLLILSSTSFIFAEYEGAKKIESALQAYQTMSFDVTEQLIFRDKTAAVSKGTYVRKGKDYSYIFADSNQYVQQEINEIHLETKNGEETQKRKVTEIDQVNRLLNWGGITYLPLTKWYDAVLVGKSSKTLEYQFNLKKGLAFKQLYTTIDLKLDKKSGLPLTTTIYRNNKLFSTLKFEYVKQGKHKVLTIIDRIYYKNDETELFRQKLEISNVNLNPSVTLIQTLSTDGSTTAN